jgi:hypothetical protein
VVTQTKPTPSTRKFRFKGIADNYLQMNYDVGLFERFYGTFTHKPVVGEIVPLGVVGMSAKSR